MTLLSVRDLDVDVRGAAILRGVDLDLGPGEVHGLIGESGSGKSMTALAVMGLLPAGAEARGRVDLAGRDLLALPEHDLCRVRGRGVGMVFQEPHAALDPLQTIGAQVAEAITAHHPGIGRREARARAADALARCGLPPDHVPPARHPHQLSGGQKQRAVIAAAVANGPRLLIADEPTTALDVTTQARVLGLLRGLVRDEGMGLLLITHDLAVVAGMADRLSVMQGGRVVERGPTMSVLRGPRHPHTRALMAASTPAPRRRAHPPGEVLLEVRGAVREHPLPRPHPFARRPRLRAVDGVSLTVRAGERVGLVGESGSGKSTLARAILGLDRLQGGAITLGGAPVWEAPRAVRRRMQAVFQDPHGSLDPRHRIARVVAEPLHLLDRDPGRAERARMVAEALAAVGLPENAAGRHPHAFSGGQRQRIAIARALVLGPDLIVLDEAVSALDVSVRARVLDLLADLSDRLGLAYLFVSHDLAVVRAVCDRVLVMRDGRIVEEGPTEAVLSAPAHPYTRALIDAAPRLPQMEDTDAA